MHTRTTLSNFAILFAATTALAQQKSNWLEIKDFAPLTQRLAVTIENPADVPVDSAPVRIKLSDLSPKLPDARPGQLCVADPADTTPPKRDRANEYFVPFQISNDTLIFAVPLKAREKKQVYLYTAPEHLNLPGFPPKTAWDNRYAYRSFENNLIAYRMETGPGANTMGFGIDSFGKTKQGIGLRLQEAYEHGHDSYHKLAYWGVDILKVGYGPAIGGTYVFSGDASGRPQFATSYVDCVYTGPVETLVKCWAPIEVAGKKVKLTRMLTLLADDRTIHDDVTVEGDSLDGLEIGIGIRDLPNGKWIENKDAGYAISSGDTNQPDSGYTTVAIAALFPKSSFTRIVELPDPKNAKPGFGDAGHAYVLKPELKDGKLTAHNRLTMIWNGDGQINNTPDLEKALQQWAAQRDNPVKVTISDKPESK